MLDLTALVSNWPINEHGWRVAPADCPHFPPGAWVRVGENCVAGNGFAAGYGFLAGDDFRAGNGFTAGYGFRAGDDFRAGNNAVPIANIGTCDGYAKSLCSVNGVAYIGAGCRWFTLDEAIAHWSNHQSDRSMTLCLMESAKALAKLKGLRTGHDPVIAPPLA